MLEIETRIGGLVCGIDEAGRGPLAGPVTAACVHIPPEHLNQSFWKKVTDSKKLSEKRREELFEPIRAHSIFGIAEATAQEIDKLNIHHATLLAMKRAFEAMNMATVQHALIDGKFAPSLPCAVTTVIKGDSLSLSIAAASILAKVTRDRIMQELDTSHPPYGWARNAGYGTAEHLEALRKYGVTSHHRLSFAPVRERNLA